MLTTRHWVAAAIFLASLETSTAFAQCSPENCDDNNPCTIDFCQPYPGGCAHFINGGAPCDDGVPCTINDYCYAAIGICVGFPKCDDGLICTTDTCDDNDASCENTLIANQCLIDETCYANGDPNELNTCEKCVPATSTSEFTDTAADGDFCMVTDIASGDAYGTCGNEGTGMVCCTGCWEGNQCQGGATVAGCGMWGDDCSSCDDSNECTDDACNAGDCESTNNNSACSDEDACTTGGSCSNGECVETEELDCDDGLGCTTDSCDPVGGCENDVSTGCAIDDMCVPDGTDNPSNECQECVAATDADDWTNKGGDSACTDGLCKPDGLSMECCAGCWDGDSCEAGTASATCGSHGGACTSCDDEDLCTDDACAAGACTHDENDSCQVDAGLDAAIPNGGDAGDDAGNDAGQDAAADAGTDGSSAGSSPTGAACGSCRVHGRKARVDLVGLLVLTALGLLLAYRRR